MLVSRFQQLMLPIYLFLLSFPLFPAPPLAPPPYVQEHYCTYSTLPATFLPIPQFKHFKIYHTYVAAEVAVTGHIRGLWAFQPTTATTVAPSSHQHPPNVVQHKRRPGGLQPLRYPISVPYTDGLCHTQTKMCSVSSQQQTRPASLGPHQHAPSAPASSTSALSSTMQPPQSSAAAAPPQSAPLPTTQPQPATSLTSTLGLTAQPLPVRHPTRTIPRFLSNSPQSFESFDPALQLDTGSDLSSAESELSPFRAGRKRKDGACAPPSSAKRVQTAKSNNTSSSTSHNGNSKAKPPPPPPPAKTPPTTHQSSPTPQADTPSAERPDASKHQKQLSPVLTADISQPTRSKHKTFERGVCAYVYCGACTYSVQMRLVLAAIRNREVPDTDAEAEALEESASGDSGDSDEDEESEE
ncbi:hypothetical protein BDV95DRAFT_651752 [Massariosphaeria phaeospora]|uniref:Uncharacterized protein n=1 Tax=Massariosphaeria phaeospora TaxID=100035 RepID=A0A7C8I1R4_9PLEO|nr:hypothetical protein BDV95DRAFT_651752 [Massariosphaeria phaeospora]